MRARKEIPQGNMTEAEKRTDSLLCRDMELTKKIDRTERRMNAEVAVLRRDIKEKTEVYEAQIEVLRDQKQKIRDQILEYWEKHHGSTITVVFPSAMVSRRNFRELIIHDKDALLDVLDTIDRLDLVDYVFKENEIARLYAEGRLKIREDAFSVIDHFNFQVRPRKKGKSNGKGNAQET